MRNTILIAMPVYHARSESFASVQCAMKALDEFENVEGIIHYRYAKDPKEKWAVSNILAKRRQAIHDARELDVDYIIFVDDDQIVPRNAFINLILAAEAREPCIMAGVSPPRLRKGVEIPNIPEGTGHLFVRNKHGRIKIRRLHKASVQREVIRTSRPAMCPVQEVDLCGMFCTAIPRKIYMKVQFKDSLDVNKLADGTNFMLGEDGQYCLSAKAAGYRIFETWDVYCQHLRSDNDGEG